MRPPHFLLCLTPAIALLVPTGCAGDARTQSGSGGGRGESAVARIASTAQHALHANAKEPVACEACHEKLAGEYLPAKSYKCEKCHPGARLVLHAAASADSKARECWSCHDFTARERAPKACSSCHDKEQGASPAIALHDPKSSKEDCRTCHRAHQKPSLVSTRCESCHDKEQVTGHQKPGIQIKGCASCHGYHESATTASGRCTNCHRQSRAAVSVNATFDKGHKKCVTCHQQHRFVKSEVIGCRDQCHQGVVALSEHKVKQHRGCVGCHDKHDVRKSPQKACSKCHENVPRHPKDRASGSRCVGCHKPHQGAGAPVAVACASCHNNARSDRGLHQGAARRGPACKNCHEPHRFSLKQAGVKLCRGCHGARPFRGAKTIRTHAKHSNCFRCHGAKVAHQPAGDRVACATCHQKKAATARKDHKNCVNCHDPHTTKQKRACGSCHQVQARAARKDHKNCAGCHEPHSTRQKKPCGGCHQVQARSAPVKHRDCMQCHDQHSTLVKRKCSSCHQTRATGIHAAVPGSCQSCHRPHGPKGHAKPPACTSCHSRGLPALHQVSGHKDCTKCHQSHGGQPYRRRSACLACHTKKKGHEPTATMCTGCHVFGGTK